MPLTELAVRNTKPAAKPFKLADSGGLFVLVTPAGGRLWRFKYRFGGREKLLAIGSYPAVGLKDARDGRDQAKRQLANGVDPSAARQAARAKQKAVTTETFRAIAEEHVTKLQRENKAARTVQKAEWLLGFANAAFGDRPIRTISAPDVLAVLRAVEARGHHESARKLRTTIGAVFRYAAATTRADSDPTALLRGALTRPVVRSHAAVTDLEQLGPFLRAIWGYQGSPEAAAGLKLLALLALRPGELRQSEWPEVDIEAAVWTVPASRMKMRLPHRLPLSKQAIEILLELRGVAGGSKFVFPSAWSVIRPMSENTLNGALRRLGYTREQATSHGFRATFSTIANQSGLWHPDAIERALAHVEGNSVRRAYARGEHWDERVRLTQWWADECDRLRENKNLGHRPTTNGGTHRYA